MLKSKTQSPEIESFVSMLFNASGPGEKRSRSNPSGVVDWLIKKNHYTLDRGLTDYRKTFGPDFWEYLSIQKQDRNAEFHWLDGGSGMCKAMEDFLRKYPTTAKTSLFTSITYKIPRERQRELEHLKVNVRSKVRFEEMDLSTIRPIDLLTDFTGLINYTDRLDFVLSNYLRLLKSTGTLCIYIPYPITYIRTKGGKLLTLYHWIQNLEGIEFRPRTSHWAMILKKKKPQIEVPRLKLRSVFHKHFLFRLFEEI